MEHDTEVCGRTCWGTIEASVSNSMSPQSPILRLRIKIVANNYSGLSCLLYYWTPIFFDRVSCRPGPQPADRFNKPRIQPQGVMPRVLKYCAFLRASIFSLFHTVSFYILTTPVHRKKPLSILCSLRRGFFLNNTFVIPSPCCWP